MVQYVPKEDPLGLLKLVTDEYCARILAACHSKPRSALELSERFGIPIAASYRRIRELEQHDLLECALELPSTRGKPMKLYRSKLTNMYVFFENGKLRVRFDRETEGDWETIEFFR